MNKWLKEHDMWGFQTEGKLVRKGNYCGDYGLKVQKATVEMLVDTKEGCISYVINDKNYGVAWKDQQIAKGTVWAAVGRNSTEEYITFKNVFKKSY